MNKLIGATLLVLFSGCSIDTRDLASTLVAVDVWIARPTTNDITVDLSTIGDPTQTDTTTNCLTLRDSTTITGNGVPGTLVSAGGLPFDADRCTDAELTLALALLPDVLDIVVDDGSKKLEIKLVRDWFRNYQVTHCDAASCSANN